MTTDNTTTRDGSTNLVTMRTVDVGSVGAPIQVPVGMLAKPDGTLITPAQDGTDATGATPDSGGTGIRGWLSTIATAAKAALVAITGGQKTGANSVSVVVANDQTVPVTPAVRAVTYATTVAAPTSSGGIALAANGSRKALRLMNVGTVPITYAFGENPTAGQGFVLDPGAGSGRQGASDEMLTAVDTRALYAVVASGTGALAIMEGT